MDVEDSHSLFKATSLAHASGRRKYIWKLPWTENNLNKILVRHLKIINVKFAIPAVNCFI